jgi:hypothetical protein
LSTTDDEQISFTHFIENEPAPQFSQTTMGLKMDRREIKAINGQFVQISCYLITSKLDGTAALHFNCNIYSVLHNFYSTIIPDDPTVEIIWFNCHRQINDTPRTPIRNFTNESILEIFDCSVSADSGEIICLAIGQTGIVSDVCQLSIKGKL